MTNNPALLTEQDTEQLRAIHAQECRHRPHWPQDFARALQDPLISRVLILLANHPPESHAPVKHRHSRPMELEACDDMPAPIHGIPARRIGTPGAGRRPGAFSGVDLKRRASGERDDD